MSPDPALAIVETEDPASEELKSILVRATGNFRLSAKNSPVIEKVRNRLRQNGLTTLGDYLALLRDGEVGRHELDSLIAELTVGETYFFRHPDHFDTLRDHVLPAVLARNAGSRQLRIWSAGCANGAEAYSIATIVHSLLGPRFNDWNVAIVGSDINRAFLAEAEVASYSAWTLRGVTPEQRSAFFERRGAQWAVREKYKTSTYFVYHNLINEDVPSIHKNIFAFDIIFCRNVMIYFDDAVNRKVVERIGRTMVDDGWLFVGSTDFNPHLDTAFTAAKHGETILYRKAAPRLVPRPVAATPLKPVAVERPRRPVARTATPKRPDVLPARRRRAPAPVTKADIARVVDLANRGAWREAALLCERILKAEPTNAVAHYYHALVLHSTGEPARAEAALNRAIYLDRGFALAHYQLGLLRKEAHDHRACIRSFRNALDALAGVPDERTVSPCGQITAHELRDVTTQQLELLGETP